jgi:methyltransferase (TIGR00027 family)
MKKSQASLTSEGIAIARLFESEKPADERICYDPYARKLISPVFYWIGKLFADYGERKGPGVIGFLVARCRYIDDALQECLQAGLEQLIVLGAGLDSRAYRFEALKQKVKIFEVDHPATQAVKVKKIKTLFGELPSHVNYVPIDFNEESFQKLFDFGYEPKLKTLFICEGVVMYLRPQAVDQTLAFIRQNSASGSSVIFDYIYSSALTASHKRREVIKMQVSGRFTGEGLNFALEEGKLKEFLNQRGFSQVQEITSVDLHRQYFHGVNQNRVIGDIYAIARARVA